MGRGKISSSTKKNALLCGDELHIPPRTLQLQEQLGLSGSPLCVCPVARSSHGERFWNPVMRALIKCSSSGTSSRPSKDEEIPCDGAEDLLNGSRSPEPYRTKGEGHRWLSSTRKGLPGSDGVGGDSGQRRPASRLLLACGLLLAHSPLDASSHSCLTLYRTWALGWLSGRWQAMTAVFPSSTSITCCTSSLKSWRSVERRKGAGWVPVEETCNVSG